MKNSIKPPRSLKVLFPDVEKVVFAKKPLLVKVLADDCSSGKPTDGTDCAMARAVRRQQKSCTGAVIRISNSYLIHGKTAIRYRTPETVAREIVSFDRHHDFSPGDYRLAAELPWVVKRDLAKEAGTLPKQSYKARDKGKSGGKVKNPRGLATLHSTHRVRTVKIRD